MAVIPRPKRPRFVVVITAVRAVLAFAIGIALLLIPGKGQSALVGFMGIYWLVSGISSLAWARRGPFLQRLALVSGVVGVVTGVLVLLHRVTGNQLVPPDLVLPLLGLVIGLTGVLHLAGGFMVGERGDRWPAGHLLVGALEILLGTLLILEPTRTDLIYDVATIWALLAGVLLAFDAYRAHRRWLTAPVLPIATEPPAP
jgi:uncharacterized membrane protein HdeD (DUF308 family)